MIGVGIHDGIPAETYHADPCPEPSLSRSGIQTLLTETPAVFAANHPRLTEWHEWQAESNATDSTDLGEVVHAMVLGVGASYVVRDPWDFIAPKTGKPYETWSGLAKEWRDALRARGGLQIDRETHARALQIAAKLTEAIERRFGAEAWAARRCEQTMVWKRVLNGHCSDASDCEHCGKCWIWCRGRADAILPDGTIIDVKTTAFSLSSDAELGKRIALDDLDLQHCWYQDGYVAASANATSREVIRQIADTCRPPFIFAYVLTNPPFTVCFVDLDDPDLNWPLRTIRTRIDMAAHTFGACQALGTWPDRPIEAKPVYPPWLAIRMLEEA